jgi:hypothetical protein
MPAQYAPFRVQIQRDTLRELYLYGQDHPEMTLGDIVQHAVRQLFEQEGWQARPDARVRSRRPGRRARAHCPRDVFVLVEDPSNESVPITDAAKPCFAMR